jgi:hypothetical protein
MASHSILRSIFNHENLHPSPQRHDAFTGHAHQKSAQSLIRLLSARLILVVEITVKPTGDAEFADKEHKRAERSN